MHTVTFYNRRNGAAAKTRQYHRDKHAYQAARLWASNGSLTNHRATRETIDYNRVRCDGRTYYYSVRTQRYAIVQAGSEPAAPPQVERRYWLRASVDAGRWLSAASLAQAWALQREYAVSGPIYYGPEGTIDKVTA